jgi:hypothetical protein
MKRAIRYVCLPVLTLLFLSCSNSEVYEKGTQRLDSLDGAIGLLSKEMATIDTIQFQKALERFTTYQVFIKSNLNDTLLPEDAETVKRFFESGLALQAFSANRPLLLSRAATIHSQLNKLKKDISEKIPEEGEVYTAIEREQKAGTELTKLMFEQQRNYYTALQQFKQVLPSAETLIRKHNRNELPSLIKSEDEL